MKNIVVLGSGMVGRTIASDLAKNHRVTIADRDEKALGRLSHKPEIDRIVRDVTSQEDLAAAVEGKDLVISAVPGFLGFRTLKSLIELKKDVADISFMPEDVLELGQLAEMNNVTVIPDCGVAPGLPNYIIGFHDRSMKIGSVEYMVGGLPAIRQFPFEYKAPFSPADVIEEYTRPARFMENGKIIAHPALSDPELVDFEKTGTLEAFNTDGLRSLLTTMSHIPSMKEKTLRYPGHIRIIKALQVAGFFSKEQTEINGVMISPFDFTSKILFRMWEPVPGEPEFTVLRVIIRGEAEGKEEEIVYDLYDEYDPVENFSSMARTTGFTAAATAELILSGRFDKKGVYPPELVGRDPECFGYVMEYLEERKVRFEVSEVTKVTKVTSD
jgi:lysine 6-dehydrogenase